MQFNTLTLQSPNISQHDENGWVALDAPEEWATFSDPSGAAQANTWESRIAIDGMHCAACGFNVEKALNAVDGVVSAQVNASSGRARVVWSNNRTKPSEIMHAISQAGYQPFPQTNTDHVLRKQQRLLMWRLLVAGFCMMQVMMYAYPAYISKIGDITADATHLLRWASWVLTLPVILFSSGPFFSSALNDLKHRRVSMDLPVALGILITFCVSSAATFDASGWWGKEVYFDSLTMFVFFLLTGRWLESRMRNRTAGSLDLLMRRLPSSIERKNADGSYSRVGVRNIQVDDVVRVLPGEAFPADGKIVQGDTTADEALLTGESMPVSKALGANVIAGSHNLTAIVDVHIEYVGASTQYAQIVALMERVSVDKPRLAVLADRIAKPFLLFVLFAAFSSVLLLWHIDHGKALMAAVAVLVVTCPCALSLATPAAMLTSAGALARKGVLVRQLQAMEAIASVDTIIFDKTGTLTKDRIKVSKINSIDSITQQDALQLASSIAQHSLHPVSRALVNTWGKHEHVAVSDVKEIAGFGLIASTALGEVKLGSAKHCGITTEPAEAMQLFMSNAQGWLATFTLEEEVREDAKATIQTLLAYGFNVTMLSGDRVSAAQLVAKHVGIAHVVADCTPQQKLAYMQNLQQQGHKVAMVGDGLNDGPVLAGANVSIAMGQAVPLAQAQCDFVVQGGQLALLPQLIIQARQTMQIVKQNLIWAALYNTVCVPLAILGYLPAWLAGLGMALSSLLVILNAARLSNTQHKELT